MCAVGSPRGAFLSPRRRRPCGPNAQRSSRVGWLPRLLPTVLRSPTPAETQHSAGRSQQRRGLPGSSLSCSQPSASGHLVPSSLSFDHTPPSHPQSIRPSGLRVWREGPVPGSPVGAIRAADQAQALPSAFLPRGRAFPAAAVLMRVRRRHLGGRTVRGSGVWKEQLVGRPEGCLLSPGGAVPRGAREPRRGAPLGADLWRSSP